MLDTRPGLAAYARASYDLELRGKITEATALMRRALDDAVDPHDAAFCRTQLGDLAFGRGDLATAAASYAAALDADPTSIAGDDAIKVEVAGLYWHFVYIVWIAIFTLIYLVP